MTVSRWLSDTETIRSPCGFIRSLQQHVVSPKCHVAAAHARTPPHTHHPAGDTQHAATRVQRVTQRRKTAVTSHHGPHLSYWHHTVTEQKQKATATVTTTTCNDKVDRVMQNQTKPHTLRLEARLGPREAVAVMSGSCGMYMFQFI